jgi:hypothetical protein
LDQKICSNPALILLPHPALDHQAVSGKCKLRLHDLGMIRLNPVFHQFATVSCNVVQLLINDSSQAKIVCSVTLGCIRRRSTFRR